jgi:hypothetical protein
MKQFKAAWEWVADEEANLTEFLNAKPGIVSKRADRRYRAGRSKDWVKVKNRKHPAYRPPNKCELTGWAIAGSELEKSKRSASRQSNPSSFTSFTGLDRRGVEILNRRPSCSAAARTKPKRRR